MKITTVGIDLAKDIITVYAQDTQGHCVLSRDFKFKELAEGLIQLPAGCVIGMEACSTARHWARRKKKTCPVTCAACWYRLNPSYSNWITNSLCATARSPSLHAMMKQPSACKQ